MFVYDEFREVGEVPEDWRQFLGPEGDWRHEMLRQIEALRENPVIAADPTAVVDLYVNDGVVLRSRCFRREDSERILLGIRTLDELWPLVPGLVGCYPSFADRGSFLHWAHRYLRRVLKAEESGAVIELLQENLSCD